MKNPKLITKPFAQNGQKNAIPENFSSSMESNQATWDTGFGQITMIPVAAGGLPPKGQDFNGIFNQISENVVYLSKGGRFKFSDGYAAAINGYPKGAILQSDDETKEYQSIIDNNKVNFNTATQAQINAAWKLISTDDMLQQIEGKQPSGNYAIKGDSYTKTESDGRYQPKGNYAPAGDYATNTALNNGLNQKFDKTGGAIDGGVTGTALGVTRKSINSTLYLYPAPDSQPNGYAYFQYKIGTDWFGRVEVPRPVNNQTTRLMQVGDFGWGASKKENSIKETDFGINKHRTFGVFYHDSDAKNTPNGHQYGGGIFFGRDPAVSTHMLYSPDWSNRLYMRSSKSASTMNDWAEFYSTEIAKSDRNGHLKRTNFPDELSDYPVGAPIPWPQATAPSGFLVCNGQSFNKTTYPLLTKAYPTGVLPDLRGEFLRGLDAGRGVNTGRAVLSAEGDAFRAHNHSVIGEDSGSGTAYFGRGNGSRRSITKDAMNLEGGTETRPRNIAFLYIVRAA